MYTRGNFTSILLSSVSCGPRCAGTSSSIQLEQACFVCLHRRGAPRLRCGNVVLPLQLIRSGLDVLLGELDLVLVGKLSNGPDSTLLLHTLNPGSLVDHLQPQIAKLIGLLLLECRVLERRL